MNCETASELLPELLSGALGRERSLKCCPILPGARGAAASWPSGHRWQRQRRMKQSPCLPGFSAAYGKSSSE